MKKILLAAFFAYTVLQTTAQIPNAGMEFWDGQPVLLGWETNSRPLTLPPWDPYIVRKDTAKFSGNYAADFYGNGFLKPFAKTTFAISTHPLSLSLWYRLAFAPCVNDNGYPEQDTVSVLVEILSNSTVVDSSVWQSKTSELYYKQLILPLTQNASVFDSCRITITGGKNFGGCGFAQASTHFWVDALSLNYADTACVDSGKINTSAICLGIYDPVCGCNGITYSNSCQAENYGGVTSWTAGECAVQAGGYCHAQFSFIRSNDSVSFTNQSTAAQVTGYAWLFGDDSVSTDENPVHVYAQPGWYRVCLAISGLDSTGAACAANFCDTLYITDGCIDSSQICPPGSLCCDAPLQMPVCGCDSVTYMNACVAASFGGVMFSYDGECSTTTAIKNSGGVFSKLQLQPNPAANATVLSFELLKETAVQVQVKNLMGETVFKTAEQKTTAGYNNLTLPLANLAGGIYIVEVIANGKTSGVRKLIKL